MIKEILHNCHLPLWLLLLIQKYFEQWNLCLRMINLWSIQKRNIIIVILWVGSFLWLLYHQKNDAINYKIIHLPLFFCYRSLRFTTPRLIESNNLKSKVKSMIQWQQKLRVQLYYDNGLNKYIVLLTSKQDHTPLGVFCLLQP